MGLRDWAESGWLRPHKTGKRRSQASSGSSNAISPMRAATSRQDWRFGISYNAALRLCTILLCAEGYRAERTLQHYRTIQALGLTLGPDRTADVEYLEVCRKRRNVIEYDAAGSVSDRDADELVALVVELRQAVVGWLRQRHPELMTA